MFRQLMLCFTATVKPCYTINGNQTNVPGIEDQAGGAGLPLHIVLTFHRGLRQWVTPPEPPSSCFYVTVH